MNSRSLRLYTTSTDEELLAALRTDNTEAYAEIFRRYATPLFQLTYLKLKSKESAEELVQDLFESLWLKRADNQPRQLEQYLFSAMKYRILNHVRATKVRAAYEAYCNISQTQVGTTTEETIALDDLSTALLHGMEKLPEKSREIFRLSRLEHFSVPEIALRVNLSVKAVEFHLTRSLKIMRVHLKDFLVILTLYFLR